MVRRRRIGQQRILRGCQMYFSFGPPVGKPEDPQPRGRGGSCYASSFVLQTKRLTTRKVFRTPKPYVSRLKTIEQTFSGKSFGNRQFAVPPDNGTTFRTPPSRGPEKEDTDRPRGVFRKYGSLSPLRPPLPLRGLRTPSIRCTSTQGSVRRRSLSYCLVH